MLWDWAKNFHFLLIIISLWLLHRIFVSKNFFFSFVCWLLNFLWFIKGTNKTDSSLHSMKSVSLILLFYFFFSIVSCTKQQWALFKQCVANDELWTRMTHQEKRSLCLSIYLYCGQVSLTKYHLHDPSQHGRLLQG